MNTRIIGIALIVLGAGLLIWGYQMSDSLVSDMSETLTGSLPDEVMTRYIGGAVSLAVGLVLLMRKP